MKCVMKNYLWFQKRHKEFGEFSHKQLRVMFDKSFVYNVLAEGMYFLDKRSPSNFNFWTFHCLPEFFQIFHVIFGTRSPEEGNDRGRGALPCILRVLLPIHIENSLSVYLFFEFQPQLGKTEEFSNQVVNENRTFRILFITKTQ